MEGPVQMDEAVINLDTQQMKRKDAKIGKTSFERSN
jgi:hypothetical protein